MKFNPTTALYSILHGQVMPFVSGLADSQVSNLVRLMEGLFTGRSVHLGRIASELPSGAQKLSVVKQMTRFLGNGRVGVEAVYAPIARELLRRAAEAGRIVLLIDSTKVGFRAQLMMVSVAYQGRALPITWTWVGHAKGHSLTASQVALVERVRGWLPAAARVALVGDSEFGRCWLLEELKYWGWQYALRQSPHNSVWRRQDTGYLRLDQIDLTGQGVQWFPHTLLTETTALPTHLLGYWQDGQPAPWWLATNLTDPDEVLALYRLRMWTEEMFGDLKGNGFDLEATHLRNLDKLNRLTLAVCLLYVSLVALGVELTKLGRAREVDRHDRRDLSFFRRGFDFLKRCLKLNQPILPGFFPDFAVVSGG
jgi:hypothetical protein